MTRRWLASVVGFAAFRELPAPLDGAGNESTRSDRGVHQSFVGSRADAGSRASCAQQDSARKRCKVIDGNSVVEL